MPFLSRVPLAVALVCATSSCNVSNRHASGDPALSEASVARAPRAIPNPPVPVFDLNGFEISGFEYWPWVTGLGNPYAENRVQFGYANRSSDAAQACTQFAYDLLHLILQRPGPWLSRLASETDAPRRFFLWNNDYTRYNQNHGATVYNWKNSYIKWQHFTDRQGRCWVPTRQTLEDFAACEHQKKIQKSAGDCGSSKLHLSTAIDKSTQLPVP